MRISNIQPYAVNNNAFKTHPEKFTSKPANYNAADSVSFKGRTSTRAASFLLGALTAFTAIFGIGGAKANAMSPIPGSGPDFPPPEPDVVIGCTEEDIFGEKEHEAPLPVEVPPKTDDTIIGCTVEDIYGPGAEENNETPLPVILSSPESDVIACTIEDIYGTSKAGDSGVITNEPPLPTAEYYAEEAKAAREKANEADEKAKQLEAEAAKAQSAAYILKETKTERYAVRSANDTASYINNYIDMTNSSINNVEKFMTKVEKAIETGELSGEDAELAQALMDEIRNGIANVQVASEEAGASGSALKDSASKTSKLIQNATDAAKDGVNLGTLPQIKKSGEGTKEATSSANDKAKDLRTAFEGMMRTAEKLQRVAISGVNPEPLRAPMKQLPIYDAVEDLTGRTPEEIEASSLKGQAQMARKTADNLIKEAERLEEKAKAYAIIAKASAAEIRAKEANENLEVLKEEMEAAEAAAKDSRDAVPARIAGRSALQDSVYSGNLAITNLKYYAEKAQKVLDLADSEGVDENSKAALESAIANIDSLIEDIEGKNDATSAAARDAMNSKNKQEANAAMKKLNETKAALETVVNSANAKTSDIKAAIKEVYKAIEALTGELPLVATMPDSIPFPTKVIACGSLEIFGKTEEEIAATAAKAAYADGKREAQTAQANYETLQGDAERAKAMLIILESEEAENE